MTPQRLENYLRTYRKKSGLSQREVAFLLGCRNGARVSRYEKRRSMPPLPTALACEAVFGAPVSELFAGMRDGVGKDVARRILQLRSKLQATSEQGSKASRARIVGQKLGWLGARVVPSPSLNNPS